VTALAIAAGQGAVVLVTGSLLAQLGRSLQGTVLLGLLIGLFDFAMYLVQMAIPAAELGWARTSRSSSWLRWPSRCLAQPSRRLLDPVPAWEA